MNAVQKGFAIATRIGERPVGDSVRGIRGRWGDSRIASATEATEFLGNRANFNSADETLDDVSSGPPSASESARIKRGYIDGAEPTHSDLLLQETGRRRYRAIIDSLKATHPEAVLDLGCGEGNLATMLSGAGLEIKLLVGCDLDRSKLFKASRNRPRDPGAAYIRADAENLPLKPGSFTVVVATEILEHVPDVRRCLSELKRLAPKRIILTVPALRYPMFLFAMGSERLDAWRKKRGRSSSVPNRVLTALLRLSEGPGLPIFMLVGILKARRLAYYDYRLYHGNLPHRLYTTAFLVALLGDLGFKVEGTRGVGFSIPFVPELEVLLRHRGIASLAGILARVQAGLDERFERVPDRSQNIMIVATVEERLG